MVQALTPAPPFPPLAAVLLRLLQELLIAPATVPGPIRRAGVKVMGPPLAVPPGDGGDCAHSKNL